MKVKSNVKAGDGIHGTGGINHNQTVKGLRVKSKVRAGDGPAGTGGVNHSQTVRHAR